ncbi:SET domain-containing protein [Fistulina hepatica ATCC 64428]|uniref:SET domain-containing protein n=1 Tax=Fistulina hepatica ATCC 64428 TaxID=1128425 RepID=A0A0D7A6P0_9AGAR|nr:SET domain-containing protein [Fistulina hepatica ATCC 64428]
MPTSRVETLLKWCAARDIVVDPRLSLLDNPDRGISIHCVTKDGNGYIAPNVTVVDIPRDSILCVKNCTLATHISTPLTGVAAQMALALALYTEIAQGARSKWDDYLQSLPPQLVDLPLFWDDGPFADDDGKKAALWLVGSGAAGPHCQGDAADMNDLRSWYDVAVRPLFTGHLGDLDGSVAPTFEGFCAAYAHVSSRSFLVDCYHGLAMVPIADAFNHSSQSNVHLESDFDVCPECGSLGQCMHDSREGDRGPDDGQMANGDTAVTFEMVTTQAVAAGAEVFNTYGALSNAELLVQYGFVLDVNEQDFVAWRSSDVLDLIRRQTGANLSLDHLLLLCADVCDALRKTGELWESQLVGEPDDESFSSSRANAFSVDVDGSLSSALWAAFAVAAILSEARVDEAVMVSSAMRIWELQKMYEMTDAVETIQKGDAVALQTIALCAIELCAARRKELGRGLSTGDIGEVLDDLSLKRRTRLAVSLLFAVVNMTDR